MLSSVLRSLQLGSICLDPHQLAFLVEVVITTILCWRKIYPEKLFVPRDSWGVSVWQSAHPTLKEWIGRQVKEIVVGLFNVSSSLAQPRF